MPAKKKPNPFAKQADKGKDKDQGKDKKDKKPPRY